MGGPASFRPWPQKLWSWHLRHAPLTSQARKAFNAKAAWDFFGSQKDLNYGYGTLLTGWIDSAQGNYPCLPPYADDDEYGEGGEGATGGAFLL